MFTDHDLQELLHYNGKGPVLSVYLNTDPSQASNETQKKRLRSFLKDIDLPLEVETVRRYFEREHDWSGRSVVVFSCVSDEFFRAFSLAVPVRSRVRVSDRPFVKPLADLLDSYGGYGVVLVDKQGARLFNFHLGQLQEQDGLVGESVRHTKHGGGSQATGRRGGVAGQTAYMEEVADRNMKDVSDFATHFFTVNNVRRILICGTDENVALFRNQLPKAWQSLVVGTFPMSMSSSHSEVLERAMQLGSEAEIRRESLLASAVVTGAAKGHGGAIHLEETLGALREGRVLTLLVRDGYRSPGSRCLGCGYLSSVSIEVCPFCGGKVAQITDVVEDAVRKVMEQGGEVEVLHQDQETPGFENIGALLRF